MPTPDPTDTTASHPYPRPPGTRCGCEECEDWYQESRMEITDALISMAGLAGLAVVTGLGAALVLPRQGWTFVTVAAAVIAACGFLANVRTALGAWSDLRWIPCDNPEPPEPGEDQPS
ncbi:MAG: hypothetical protein JWQ81_6520 [Amycolatopsis sp.]|uniref:hypothetical protein n=1 Tax=Amycolatopsis sp. TaxID=37632 RepID=UPI00262339A2|nr:hypothetical protein [Amycolatopsis sp.]MCU1685781.1 hypothetical protein [Amycolatopsis sp.]